MIEGLTDEHARKLYRYTQRLRDKLAIDINQGTLRDSREFREICELLTELGDVFRPQVQGLPPGIEVDRRARPR